MRYFLDEPTARFRPTLQLPEGDALLFAFQDGNLVVRDVAGTLEIPSESEAEASGLAMEGPMSLGTFDGRACKLALVPAGEELPAPFAAKSLRRLFGALDMDLLMVAATASQLAHFEELNRYCGRCATPTTASSKDRARTCSRCARDIYPAVAPCTIILVHDGPRILLTRQPRFPAGMYGLVAGFVEPGESLEGCAKREIAEEVGVQVTDLVYVASQPWPVPSQLMVGLTARYAGGELVVDKEELEEAKWFDIADLPAIPPPFSIARHLIDLYLAGRGEGP